MSCHQNLAPCSNRLASKLAGKNIGDEFQNLGSDIAADCRSLLSTNENSGGYLPSPPGTAQYHQKEGDTSHAASFVLNVPSSPTSWSRGWGSHFLTDDICPSKSLRMTTDIGGLSSPKLQGTPRARFWTGTTGNSLSSSTVQPGPSVQDQQASGTRRDVSEQG
jgi:hypothetical protein